MYDLAIAILGSGETTYNNAADLLWDYLPENYVVYIPSYINSGGMKNVWKFLQDENIHYERVKKSNLIETLEQTETKIRQLVILNSDGIENEISHCLQAKIPVFDLTRGLYQVTEVPLPEAGSDSEAIEQQDAAPVPPEKDLALGSVLARLEKIEQDAHEVIRKVRDMHAQILTGEANWEPLQEPETGMTGMDVIKMDPGLSEAAGLTPYWKSKRGNLRKAGKSKARPGETLVHLTQEEMDNLE